MKAFVTGGSGFIGRNLIAELVRRGHSVRALARSPQSMNAVKDSGAEPVRGDLDDLAALGAGASGCEVLFHCAAHTQEWAPREEFFRINVQGTQNVIRAAEQAWVRRLVHVSTEAALVDGTPLVQVDEMRALPARALGSYSETKALAEAKVRQANSPKLETVVIAPRLVWGKGDNNMLPKLAEAMRSGRFRWIGGGTYLTSTCHVRNACEGLLLAAEKGEPGAKYFVTDGEPIEFRAFIRQMMETQGVDAGERTLPRWLAKATAVVTERLWLMVGSKTPPPLSRTAFFLIGQEVTVNDTKARRELGYRPPMTLAAGLKEMRG